MEELYTADVFLMGKEIVCCRGLHSKQFVGRQTCLVEPQACDVIALKPRAGWAFTTMHNTCIELHFATETVH